MQDNPSVPPWSGQPYSAKRHGVTITNCDSEPVHIPGCIQAHGVMLVLNIARFTIAQASENVERWWGQPATALLGRAVSALVGDAGQAEIERVVQNGTDANPRYVFTLPADGARPALDVTAHTSSGAVVVEMEPCVATAAPRAREPYSWLKRAVEKLQAAASFQDFSRLVCEELQALTGFERVMVYRFHEDLHGEVTAEARLPTLTPWLGLHYPAEDIPEPARQIFKKTWVRPVPDVNSELVELVPLTNPETGRALDMTQCALRGPSIMYTEYLRNMGVRSALTLPIRRGDQLWGLIACHGYSAPVHLPFQLRVSCELFAQVVSLQHQAAEEREHAQYRARLDIVHAALVKRSAQRGSLAELTRSEPSLLAALDASGAAVYEAGEWSTVGSTPDMEQLDGLRIWLEQMPEFETVFSTHQLPRLHPPAKSFAATASGVLSLRLGRPHNGLLLWFRPETRLEVRWAGNPSDKPSVIGPHGPRLTPRRSFELFLESVKESSRPWTTIELDAAERLRHYLFELVLVQAERLAEANERLHRINHDLTRSNEELDAFAYVASHDLKEPLRGINKYAHQLLADIAPEDTARRSKAESLLRLTVRMDTLIDSLLHFSRVGRVSLDLVPVPLDELVQEALEMLGSRRAEHAVLIVIPRPMPVVRGDRVQLREVLSNLLSNAMKYNDKTDRRIEIGYLRPGEAGDRGLEPPTAVGKTVFFVRDNGIGIAPAHQPVVFELFRRLHGRDAFGGGIGAGLTIVKRVLERHHGEGWVSSELGVGSTFFFTLGDAP